MKRCAVLDDYQNVALATGDWRRVTGEVAVTVFDAHLGHEAAVAEALADFEIVCLMRERTPFPAGLIEKLPKLELLITTGMVNRSLDVAAARTRGITVCGTAAIGSYFATAEMAWGLILSVLRHIPDEAANLRAGGWQRTLGTGLEGKTLGLLGLGRLGAAVCRVGRAFGMEAVAWSENLTAARCAEAGAEPVSKEELLRRADVLSVHLVLSDRTRGLIGRAELALMKPSAILVNTSRGPIVDEEALVEALARGRLRGAGLDVFGAEPLPAGHPFRVLPNVVATPHLGYVTEETYDGFFKGMVDAIRGYLDGAPVNLIEPPA
jgi:phosphoglycerate dehydrogenase-like enzyme